MKFLDIQVVSAESIRDGFVTFEDPLGGEVSSAEEFLRMKQKCSELDGYAELFHEIPAFPRPEQGREILQREGFQQIGHYNHNEVWLDPSGIAASLRVAGDQAVMQFEFQTLAHVCPYLFIGGRAPFNLANGDIVFCYNIHANPGVLQLLRMARPYTLRQWRVMPKFSTVGPIVGVSPEIPLTEYPPILLPEEWLSLSELMQRSGEKPDHITHAVAHTTSGNAPRFWYKPFQGAIGFLAKDQTEAEGWFGLYQQLAESAHAQGYRLTERNSLEFQLTGKLCCCKAKHPCKVQFSQGRPVLLDYCDRAEPELPSIFPEPGSHSL